MNLLRLSVRDTNVNDILTRMLNLSYDTLNADKISIFFLDDARFPLGFRLLILALDVYVLLFSTCSLCSLFLRQELFCCTSPDIRGFTIPISRGTRL